jgi:hypothetical protein
LEHRAENDQHQPALRALALVDQALSESLVHVRDRSKKGPQMTLFLMILGIFVAACVDCVVSLRPRRAATGRPVDFVEGKPASLAASGFQGLRFNAFYLTSEAAPAFLLKRRPFDAILPTCRTIENRVVQ